jgi:hypothetical protein
MPEKGRRDSIIGTNRYWMELLAVRKNPETQVPRCCRGHVQVKYIVWESSLVVKQRAVVQFLILKKLCVRHITNELEGVYGHETLSFSGVKKWRKRIVNGKITLENVPRSGGPLEAIFGNLCGH